MHVYVSCIIHVTGREFLSSVHILGLDDQLAVHGGGDDVLTSVTASATEPPGSSVSSLGAP